MYAEYKRDMSHNYLILHGENPVDTSSYQVRMLTGNAVPSILKCRIQGLDGNFLFYYDITSRQSLASFYEQKKLQVSDIRLIFGGVVKIMEEMMEFLLNPDQLLLFLLQFFLIIRHTKSPLSLLLLLFQCMSAWLCPITLLYRKASVKERPIFL